MTLPAKFRFKLAELKEPIRVALDINKDPISVRFRHDSWEHEKDLTVLGLSKDSDLVPRDLPIEILADMVVGSQYILTDADMNIYEAYIYVINTSNGTIGYMTGVKTKPHS